MPYIIAILLIIAQNSMIPFAYAVVRPGSFLGRAIMAYLIMGTILVIFIVKWKVKVEFGPRLSLKNFLIYALLGLGIRYAHTIVFMLFPQVGMTMLSFGEEYVNAVFHQFKNPFIFVYCGFLGPVLEELFFRGKLLTACKNSGGTVKAIIVSALFFGLTHSFPAQFATAVCLGLLCGYIYTVTNDIKAPIIIHIVNNFSSIFESLFIALGEEYKYSKTMASWMLTVAVGMVMLIFGIRQCLVERRKRLG